MQLFWVKHHSEVPKNHHLITSITRRGKVRFMLYKETMASQTLIRFMFSILATKLPFCFGGISPPPFAAKA